MSTTPTLRDAAPRVADLLIRITNCAKHWAYMAEIDNGDAAKVEAHRHGELLAELVAALTQGAGEAVEPVAGLLSGPVAEIVECQKMGQQTVREIDGRWRWLRYGDLLYTAPPAQQLQQAVARAGWQPISDAPEGELVVVSWLDDEDPEHPDCEDFDYLEEGVWQKHDDHYQHFLSCAPPGSHGPKEQAPYTHFMRLPPRAAAIRAKGTHD